MARPSRTGGKKSEVKTRKASPAKGRKTIKAKRRITTTASQVKRRSVSGASKDLKEAREQQAATAEILKVIASSPSDLQSVFEAIAESAARLCQAEFCNVFRFDGELIHFMHSYGYSREAIESLRHFYPMVPGRGSGAGRAILNGSVAQVPDVRADPDYNQGNVPDISRINSILAVPMLKEGRPVGAIALVRAAKGTFPQRQIDLLKTFADQAVIAIENVRLFNEVQAKTRDLEEALRYQTGSSNILNVIASSPTNVEPVLKAIVESACELCEGNDAVVHLREGDDIWCAAHHGPVPNALQRRAIGRDFVAGRAIIDKATIHLHDILSDEGLDFPEAQRLSAQIGIHTILGVPMLAEGKSIGVIMLRRTEVSPFSDKQIALLQTFANQAVIAIENARLFNETQEALERQTATAEILTSISGSITDPKPVFEAVLDNLLRLFGTRFAVIFLVREGMLHIAGLKGEQGFEKLAEHYPLPVDDQLLPGRAVKTGRALQIAPIMDNPNCPPGTQDFARKYGYDALIAVPMFREGKTIGVLCTAHRDPIAFTDKQVELASSFADQAVIAIENARLFNETQEALERQTATADILKVIASSPDDVQPVFEAIAERSKRLVNALSTTVFTLVDGMMHLRAFTAINSEADATLQTMFPASLSAFSWGGPIRRGDIYRVVDTENEAGVRDVARLRGFRSMLLVPLLRDRHSIGVISVTRVEPGPFANHHVQLLQTFADQAVIAIENVRLFNETKEALERQTATSEVLQVISGSMADSAPVFESILDSCEKLLQFTSAAIVLVDGNQQLQLQATRGPGMRILQSLFPQPLNSTFGQPIRDLQPLYTANMAENATATDAVRLAAQKVKGYSALGVPMVWQGRGIGSISVSRLPNVAFSDKEVALLKTFADQAVVAIQNARLFNETKEALEQQTATAEILKVIASSPDDVQPVLEAVSESAMRLLDGWSVLVTLFDGEQMHFGAARGSLPDTEQYLRGLYPAPLDAETSQGRCILERTAINIPDAQAHPSRKVRERARLRGFRAGLVVPMLRDGQPIGAISVARTEAGAFAAYEIELLQTFADQAVIAIENTRLFNEVQAKTLDLEEALRYQTGSANILNVIASSPTDVQPVLKAIVESACELCEAYDAVVILKDGEDLQASAHHGPIPLSRQRWGNDRTSSSGRAIADRRPVHVHDVLCEEGVEFAMARSMSLVDGCRTLLSAPLLREGEAIGAIALRRAEVHPFSEKQIALLQTFADQAVIAIGNVRLFDEVRARTRELTQSLEDLRTAQDRLIQTEKLASLGQLTAGIAHEIKNPLNFVNNFSALSVELTDDLNDVLKQAELVETIRKEVEELTGLLKDNLSKVVQHGKRADSIVKNMLLHSREGTGEHRSADINALVEESLNLAYHGARAEKSGFEITLRRDLDPDAGVAELYPQEITRALLNLISNGFYAATRRKAENGDAGFEPTLLATTRNLGSSVQILIRDNGTGILPEVKEKMFNPFFTTKPAGEGTGLGLSMSHDIIVKQHGGRIDVETEPGVFTEFIVTLRRKGLAQKTSGETK